jgi:Lrp/AsnC family transcriptional regulator for asnA, asnC and gidA
MPLIQLSKKLKISNTLVHQRLKKLRDAGILKNATYQLDAWKLGYQSSAFVQIMLTNAKLHRGVEEELAKIPEIVECVNIAGRYALIVKVYARNNRHLRDVIYEKIQPIEGVEGTNTTMSFETAFTRPFPLSMENEDTYD